MNSNNFDSVLIETETLFKENSIWWPMPIINFLENKKAKSSLGWALELFREVVSSMPDSSLRELYYLWLKEFEEIYKHDGLAKDWEKKAYEIWTFSPEFNSFERAVSRLHIANEAFYTRTPENYRGSVASAVSLLSRMYGYDFGEERVLIDQKIKDESIIIFLKNINDL